MTARGMRLAGQVRRHLPAAFLPVSVAARSVIDRRRMDRWEHAVAEMRFVLGDDVTQAEVERRAVRYLRRMAWHGEVRWHPDLITRQQVVGAEHLRDAIDAGRGCLLSFVHHGDYEGAFGSLAREGLPTHNMATSDMFREDSSAWVLRGRDVLQHVPGVSLFDVSTGSQGIRDALARGCAVGVALDPPGRTAATFLDHRVSIATGGSRIAMEMGVPVVPMIAERDPRGGTHTARVRLLPALQPHDFDGPGSLLREMIRAQEEAIRKWPEAACDPVGWYRLVPS